MSIKNAQSFLRSIALKTLAAHIWHMNKVIFMLTSFLVMEFITFDIP
jgi:hypothetical protein